MKEKWFEMRKGADFLKIAETFGINPIIARLIRNRDLIDEKEIDCYLHGSLDELFDGMLMKDMDKAVAILSEKIQEGKTIRIIGDYDIDGVNAAYILLEGIKSLGGQVDTDIPDRMKDGYGLNAQLIDRALECDIDTIITCDNGIAAYQEVQYAKSMGMTVIITDHHEVPYEEVKEGRRYILPPADAVVNPKQTDCTYPFDGLCGAGVAYKVVEALINVTGGDAEEIDYLMENVAIATVGDVMDLVNENRIFVKQGLEMIQHTKNLGLKALMECTQISPEHLSAYHIGFVLGPCMNASGRLDTAKRALDLLCSKSKKEADILAGDLKALNDHRKEMTMHGVQQAMEQLQNASFTEQKILVIYLPDCHESLAGIIAGRIREAYHKPCIVLTKGEVEIKGSGRSIEAYNMFEEFSKCKDLYTKFGGHHMAVGLSMKEENLMKFREKINQLTTLTKEDFIPKVSIDMQLPFHLINEQLIQELTLLEPFGKGNTKPLFAEKEIQIKSMRIIGKNKNVLKFSAEDQRGTGMEAIYFGKVETCIAYMSEKFGEETIKELLNGKKPDVKMAFTYYPDINEYMGQKKLQIVVQNYQ
ncbi:MAG: single-stranded-DNA-specific exonuclease RecJ [Lachnospiraceae bacterium]